MKKRILQGAIAIALALVVGSASAQVTKPPVNNVAGPTTSSQLGSIITDETGTGSVVFNTSPTLITPALGTPSSGDLSGVTARATGSTVDRTLGARFADETNVNNFASISAMSSALGYVRFPAGAYTVSTNTTITDVPTYFDPGASVSISTGVTLTFANSVINSPRQQIFTGAGVAAFTGRYAVVEPEWWGAKSDGTTACGPSMAAMFTSLAAMTESVVQFNMGIYVTGTTAFTLPRAIALVGVDGGQGDRRTVFQTSMTSGDLFTTSNVGVKIYGIQFEPQAINTTGSLIKSDHDDLWVENVSGYDWLRLVDSSGDRARIFNIWHRTTNDAGEFNNFSAVRVRGSNFIVRDVRANLHWRSDVSSVGKGYGVEIDADTGTISNGIIDNVQQGFTNNAGGKLVYIHAASTFSISNISISNLTASTIGVDQVLKILNAGSGNIQTITASNLIGGSNVTQNVIDLEQTGAGNLRRMTFTGVTSTGGANLMLASETAGVIDSISMSAVSKGGATNVYSETGVPTNMTIGPQESVLGLGIPNPNGRFEIRSNSSVVTSTAASAVAEYITNTNQTNNTHSDLGFATLTADGTWVMTSAVKGIHTSHANGTAGGSLSFQVMNDGTLATGMTIGATGIVTIPGTIQTSSSTSIPAGMGFDTSSSNGVLATVGNTTPSWLYTTFPVSSVYGNTIFATGLDGTGDVHRATIMGAQTLQNATSINRVEAFGQGALRWAKFPERVTAIGSLSMQWLGMAQADLPAHFSDYWYPVLLSDVAWDLQGMETRNPGLRAKLLLTPDAVTSEDTSYNVGVGRDTLVELVNGYKNAALGYRACAFQYYGNWNTCVGNEAGEYGAIHNEFTGLGYFAGNYHSEGDNSTFIGSRAGSTIPKGQKITIVGSRAANTWTSSVDGIVLLGYGAGSAVTPASNMLVIDNAGTGTPLVLGSFATNTFGINIPQFASLIPSRLHVGATTLSGVTSVAGSGDVMVLDSNGNTGATVLSGAANTGSLYFGRSGSTAAGRVQYDHSTDGLLLRATNQTIVDGTSTGVSLRFGNSEVIGITSGQATFPGKNAFSGNVSSAAWTTVGPKFNIPALTLTDTTSTGTVALKGVHTFGVPTVVSSNATTLTAAATVYIDGPPTAGSGTTITTGYALYAAGSIFATSNIQSQGIVLAGSSSAFRWPSKGGFTSSADGVVLIANQAQNDFGRLQFGGTTSSFPAIKRSGTTLAFRLADDSADAGITAGASSFTGTLGLGITSPNGLAEWRSGSSVVTATTASAVAQYITNTNQTNNTKSDFGFATLTADSTWVTTSRIAGIHTSHTNAAASGALSFQTMNAGTMATAMTISANGNVSVASLLQAATTFSVGASAISLATGAIGMSKMTASGVAPGAGGGKLELVCGTNAGSAKLVAYAGTSGTAVTILDNIGSGVTGC